MRTSSVILGLVLATATGAHAAPADRVAELVGRLKAFPAASQGAARDKALTALDAYFDLDAFAASALGASKDKLTEAQAKTFRTRLSDLLRRKGYPAGAALFRNGRAKAGPVTTEEGRTTVAWEVFLPDEDVTVVVGFVVDEAGKVVDVAIDGEPMTADYRNQVARVLAKKSPEELLERLAAKQRETDG